MQPPSIQEIVLHSARACGFHLAGLAPVGIENSGESAGSRFSEDGREQTFPELSSLEQWFAEGRAGEMEYLQRRNADGELLRSSVQVPFPWVRSVIVCAVNYH